VDGFRRVAAAEMTMRQLAIMVFELIAKERLDSACGLLVNQSMVLASNEL
jgi:hypothetical protein